MPSPLPLARISRRRCAGTRQPRDIHCAALERVRIIQRPYAPSLKELVGSSIKVNSQVQVSSSSSSVQVKSFSSKSRPRSATFARVLDDGTVAGEPSGRRLHRELEAACRAFSRLQPASAKSRRPGDANPRSAQRLPRVSYTTKFELPASRAEMTHSDAKRCWREWRLHPGAADACSATFRPAGPSTRSCASAGRLPLADNFMGACREHRKRNAHPRSLRSVCVLYSQHVAACRLCASFLRVHIHASFMSAAFGMRVGSLAFYVAGLNDAKNNSFVLYGSLALVAACGQPA